MAKRQIIAEAPQADSARVLVSSGGLHIKPDKHNLLTKEIRFNKRIAEGLYVSLQRVADADARWLVDALSLGVQWMSGEAFLGCKRNAHPMRMYGWPLQRKSDSFRSLVEALDGHWDKPFDVLPPRAKVRVLRDFGPGHWDSWNRGQRKSLATQRDYQHDPATKAEREREWDLVSNRQDVKDKISRLNRMEEKTPLDMESKTRQLADLEKELAKIEQQLCTPAESKPGSEAAVPSVHTNERSNIESTSTNADTAFAALFDSVKVAALEKMFPANGKWQDWAERASRNKLNSVRTARGLFNPYLASVWFLKQGETGWNIARCNRVLANNLPARSKDKRHLLTDELEE